jgi:IS605 OrfB family transposase
MGWIPIHADNVRFDGEAFVFRQIRFYPKHMRDTPVGLFRAGTFSQDARGHWYINLPVEVERAITAPPGEVGIDLGLKSLAVLSDGEVIETPAFYRKSEEALATAQRARKSKRVRTIHAKVRNRRKDFLHKASAKIAKGYGVIVVGDVSPSKNAKTRMAKSVMDAGWADFKTMLSYKSLMNGGTYLEVSEAYTTQTCSSCGSKDSPTRPRGIAGLGIRGWTCSCGAVHDRDVNAARNILDLGRQVLAGGASL